MAMPSTSLKICHLPPTHAYFLIDFKEISSTILAKIGGGSSPNTPMVTPLIGGIKLRLPEFTFLVSCVLCHRSLFIPVAESSVLWLFTCGRGRRTSMAIENFKCSRHSLVSSIYYRAHHGWAWRKISKMKVLRRLKKAILRLAFANTVFHKRIILLISFAEFTEFRHSFVSRVHHGWARRKRSQREGVQKARKR